MAKPARNEDNAALVWRNIPALRASLQSPAGISEGLWSNNAQLCGIPAADCRRIRCKFACISVVEKRDQHEFVPSPSQLLTHPLALIALVPKDAALFAAGAVAGAAAKTVTAPLDRIKLLMQTHGVRVAHEGTKKAIGFIEAITTIGQNEGVKGYWKGNLPQVIRVIPYSAVQLFAYEFYKKLLRGKDGELSVLGRLAAGACAGMTSTFITYPLDVLRLRLAVEPGYRTMSQVALNMLKEEGIASFYYGLGPSLIGIAPYIAVNFCIFDLLKKSLPEKVQKRTETSLLTALISASCATLTCYPLDTVRRQMQMRGTPYKTVLEAISGIIAHDGVVGLYRGFVPNALKTLPNSRHGSGYLVSKHGCNPFELEPRFQETDDHLMIKYYYAVLSFSLHLSFFLLEVMKLYYWHGTYKLWKLFLPPLMVSNATAGRLNSLSVKLSTFTVPASSPLPYFLYCSIRLTVYDFVKRLIATSEKEFQQIVEDNREKKSQTSN